MSAQRGVTMVGAVVVGLVLAACSGGSTPKPSGSALGLQDPDPGAPAVAGDVPTPKFAVTIDDHKYGRNNMFRWRFDKPEGVVAYCQLLEMGPPIIRNIRFPCRTGAGMDLDPKEDYRFVLWYGPEGQTPDTRGNVVPDGFKDAAWDWEDGTVQPMPHLRGAQ